MFASSPSSVCRNSKPISVTRVYKHKRRGSQEGRFETKRYHSTKAKLGANKVRGAGHTKAVPKIKYQCCKVTSHPLHLLEPPELP